MKGNLKDCTEIEKFTKTCMLNSFFKEDFARFQYHWQQASSVSEFKEMVFADKSLAQCQGYAELSKESEGHWYRVRAMFGDRAFKTESDAGSVMIKSEDGTFSVLVPNKNGDGVVRCAIFDKESDSDVFNSDMMQYTGIMLKGKMNIMCYDCGNGIGVAKKISGRYQVYAWKGLVAFVECK